MAEMLTSSTKLDRPPDAREASFSRSIDSTRWWRGKPEQIQVFITPYRGTSWLGLAKSNLVPRGITQVTGRTKPHQYQQSARAYYYNLGDEQQVRALLRLFAQISTYSAGWLQENSKARYALKLGESKVLDEAEIRGMEGKITEQVILRCENANHRALPVPYHAQDPAVRKRVRDYWQEHKKKAPLPRLTFELSRRDERYGRGHVGGLDTGTEFTIPIEVAARLAEEIGELIREYWSRSIRSPERVYQRLDDHPDARVRRRQLHRFDSIDLVLMPRLDEAFKPEPELALQTHPLLYREFSRLKAGQSDGPADYQRLSGMYWERLKQYGGKRLRWRLDWSTPEWRAQQDLAELRHRFHQISVAQSKLVLLYCILYWFFCHRVKFRRPVTQYLGLLVHQCSRSRLDAVLNPVRGPPSFE